MQLLVQPPPPIEVDRRQRLLSAAELALLRCEGNAEVPQRTWQAPRPAERLAAAPSAWSGRLAPSGGSCAR